MNSIIVLVVASLLVAAMVAIAIPNAIEAKKPHQWCNSNPFGGCFDNRADCEKNIIKDREPNCVKTVIG